MDRGIATGLRGRNSGLFLFQKNSKLRGVLAPSNFKMFRWSQIEDGFLSSSVTFGDWPTAFSIVSIGGVGPATTSR